MGAENFPIFFTEEDLNKAFCLAACLCFSEGLVWEFTDFIFNTFVLKSTLGFTNGSNFGTSTNGTRVLGNQYDVLKVVGEGAYGVVMKCRDMVKSSRKTNDVQNDDDVNIVAVKEFKVSNDDPDAEEVKRNTRREGTNIVNQMTEILLCTMF